MDRSDHIFAYCERGHNAAFWAEPVNALTNLGFMLLAVLAWRELAARPSSEGKVLRYALIANVFIIGVGSVLFHTYATAWSALVDVTPIGVFMIAYLAFGLYMFAGAPLLVIPPLLAVFIFTTEKAMKLQCWELGMSLPVQFQNLSCLNGSIAYMPALAAMALIGGWLAMRQHPAASNVLGAALVFMLSITFRTVDRLWCDDVVFLGRSIGTHFLWHLFNSVTLYLLLLAAVRHGATRQACPESAAR